MIKIDEARFRSFLAGVASEMPYGSFARAFFRLGRYSTRERDKVPQEIQEYSKKLAELKRLYKQYKKEGKKDLYMKTRVEIENLKMKFHTSYGTLYI